MSDKNNKKKRKIIVDEFGNVHYKRKRPVIQEFIIHERKDGKVTYVHKLAKIDSEMGELDRYCREAPVDELEMRLQKASKDVWRAKELDKTPRYMRTRCKVIRDRIQLHKLYLDVADQHNLLEPQFRSDSDTLIEYTRYTIPVFTKVVFNPEKNRYEKYDSEGNLIDWY